MACSIAWISMDSPCVYIVCMDYYQYPLSSIDCPCRARGESMDDHGCDRIGIRSTQFLKIIIFDDFAKIIKIVKNVIFGGPDFAKTQKMPKTRFWHFFRGAHRGLFGRFFKNVKNGHFGTFRDPLPRPNLRI